jgi:predicted Zn-dependent protease
MGLFQDRKFLHPELGFSLKFPKGWKTMNSREAVFAMAPKKDGIMIIGIAGKGTDPKEPAQILEDAFVEKILGRHKR